MASAGTFAAYAVGSDPGLANALDMEAFANAELSSSECNEKIDKKCVPKTKLTDDEALCKYGMPSQGKGEACVRAGKSTAPKTPGGVDAFGKVDRGNFVRCKRFWEIIDGKYQKFDICE